MSDGFEWDENKAAENYAKHGVSFEMATKVFKDPFAIERLDDREGYGEDPIHPDRQCGRSGVDDRLHREGRPIRIISARHATKYEQDDYFVENS